MNPRANQKEEQTGPFRGQIQGIEGSENETERGGWGQRERGREKGIKDFMNVHWRLK